MRYLVLLLIVFITACSKPSEPHSCPLPSKIIETSFQELSEQEQKLLEAAETVMHKSYSPYMKFKVGAALLAEDGSIITGTNVENAAGTTICAERAAILRANAMGYRRFKSVAVIGRGHDFESKEVIAPCGFCRQVIYETAQLSQNDIQIIMSNTRKDKILVSTINGLLPLAFGPKDLGLDVNQLGQ